MGAFGGNPDAVTLVGHGTGASLVSFLMTSPVAKAGSQELFQKAILMSGSSLSPMSVCEDPKDITLQVRISNNLLSIFFSVLLSIGKMFGMDVLFRNKVF